MKCGLPNDVAEKSDEVAKKRKKQKGATTKVSKFESIK